MAHEVKVLVTKPDNLSSVLGTLKVAHTGCSDFHMHAPACTQHAQSIRKQKCNKARMLIKWKDMHMSFECYWMYRHFPKYYFSYFVFLMEFFHNIVTVFFPRGLLKLI